MSSIQLEITHFFHYYGTMYLSRLANHFAANYVAIQSCY